MKGFSPHHPEDERPGGIYIHVPFCRSRCNYCAFLTNMHSAELEQRYCKSLLREVARWSEPVELDRSLALPQFDSIYFGGGTPSLLRPDRIRLIIEACRKAFHLTEPAELTIEINPGTLDRTALETLREAGVNRASLGIQSLDDAELAAMGRGHTARDALSAFEDLRAAGFDNASVDLIAGFPGQTRASMAASLAGVLSLRPEHLSIYLLEIKDGTRLQIAVTEGRMPAPDEDLAADMYEDICEAASSAGYAQYEISNFARGGLFSRHNLKYWQDAVYLGLGPGAHGMTGMHRYANVADLDEYERLLNQGLFPMDFATGLTAETRFREALIMGLRLVEGIDLEQLSYRYKVDATAFARETIGDLEGAGLFVLDGPRLALTARGRLLSNVVLSRWA